MLYAIFQIAVVLVMVIVWGGIIFFVGKAIDHKSEIFRLDDKEYFRK